MENLIEKLEKSKQKLIALRSEVTQNLQNLHELIPKFFTISPNYTTTVGNILYEYIDIGGKQQYVLNYIITNNKAKNDEITLLGNTLLKEIKNTLNTLNSISNSIENTEEGLSILIDIDSDE